MFDLVKLSLSAGDGGYGRVNFHREKFITKGGPDGGDGGDGGSIIIRADKHLNTLQHYAGVKEYKAQSGENGAKRKQIGRNGEDVILKVPVGTLVWLLAENRASIARRTYQPIEGAAQPEVHFQKYYLDKPSGNPPEREPDPLFVVHDDGTSSEVDEHVLRTSSLRNTHLKTLPKLQLVEFSSDGQEYVVCRGGFGGSGNVAFKGSTNTTPMEAEYGTWGEKKIVLFELRLVADVGLVGYPNVGKSTFLSIVTKANPKIANYPFTTLEPNLGVMSVDAARGVEHELVLADIPGIIEGASTGKGLGFDFLRHIQACKMLLFILSLDETTIFNDSLDLSMKAEQLLREYDVLSTELQTYDDSLIQKPRMIAISKSDLYSLELQQEIMQKFKKRKMSVHFFSAVTKTGLDELRTALFTMVHKN